MRLYVEVRSLEGEQRARGEAVIAARVAADRRRLGGPVPPPSTGHLLCGHSDAPIGPSVVRGDGTCGVCSRRPSR